MRALYLLAVLLGATVASAAPPPYAFSSSIERCPCGNAPTWVADTRFRGVWNLNGRGITELAFDQSTYGNNLNVEPGVSGVAPSRADCRSAEIASNYSDMTCTAGNGCTISQFYFYSESFTAGCWEQPTNVAYSPERNGLGTFANGWHSQWNQPSLGSGTFRFTVEQPGDTKFVDSTSSYSFPMAWHNHVVQFRSTLPTTVGGTLRQYLDGDLDAATATLLVDLTSPPTKFSIGQGDFGRTWPGLRDACWAFEAQMTDTDVCRVAVCGVDGCGCDCDGTAYAYAPLHTSFGGPLTCTLPACNKAGPT